jgi:hypothetical protein
VDSQIPSFNPHSKWPPKWTLLSFSPLHHAWTNFSSHEPTTIVGQDFCDYRTLKTWLLQNRIVAGNFSQITLEIIKTYSLGMVGKLTRINESILPFLPPVLTRIDRAVLPRLLPPGPLIGPRHHLPRLLPCGPLDGPRAPRCRGALRTPPQ